jgi:hypothetical protein
MSRPTPRAPTRGPPHLPASQPATRVRHPPSVLPCAVVVAPGRPPVLAPTGHPTCGTPDPSCHPWPGASPVRSPSCWRWPRRWRSRLTGGAEPDPTARGLFTARHEPQKVYERPPSVSDCATSARDERPTIQAEPSGATQDVLGRVPRVPEVRVDPDRVAGRAPPRELSPAQALDLVRRATRRDRDDPHGAPPDPIRPAE